MAVKLTFLFILQPMQLNFMSDFPRGQPEVYKKKKKKKKKDGLLGPP